MARRGCRCPSPSPNAWAAPAGRTLTGADPSGLLEGWLEIEGPDSPTGRLQMNLSRSPAGARMTRYPLCDCWRPALQATACIFRVGPVTFLSFSAHAAATEGVADLFRLVAALEVLQAHLGALLPVPAEPLEDEDARDLMAMARALTGTPARMPFTGLSMPLQPGTIRSFLASVPRGPGVLYGAPNGVKVTLDGKRYDVPGLAFWAANVVLRNRTELEALADGDAVEAVEAVATFSSPDDSNIFMIRAVDDLGPEYRPVIDLPQLT